MSNPAHKPGLGRAYRIEEYAGRGPLAAGDGPSAARRGTPAARMLDRLTAAPPPMMRRSGRAAAVPSGHASQPPLGVIALNRLGFGPRPGDLAAFDALGPDDPARLAAYLDEQLDPGTIDDAVCDARLAASGYATLGKSLGQLWADHVVANPTWKVRMQPVNETTLATFLRAVYSKRQLFEVMVDFWHNHFSIYAWESYEGPTWVHYDRDVIRAHALGNFRQMLEAVARSTPMLLYLDNWRNSADGPNENYARELLELHTLGAEHYFGAVPRSQVPADGSGLQEGFCDEDVFAVTRCLTGWSLDADPWWKLKSGNGGYRYRADWHDGGTKNVLGVTLSAGQPDEKDFLDVLDLLATHPGTATFVCRKIARRLIGDFPPQTVVDAAAQVFLAHVASGDQIARVVRSIAESQAFRDTWGEKVKRPFEIVTSALRAADANFPFVEGDPDTDSFDWRFYQTGHYPFDWHPPNGYPDFREAWVSTGPRVLTWKLTNWLVDVHDDLGNHRLDAMAATPAGVRSANALADFWIDRILGRPMDAADRQEVVEFMAQGINPSFDLPLDGDEDLRHRLQSMVGLIFLSPEFLWR